MARFHCLGFLDRSGSLFCVGFLTSGGSLGDPGFLGSVGSLLPFGFLNFGGSLRALGFQSSFWLALSDWIACVHWLANIFWFSKTLWLARASLGYSTILARFMGLGFYSGVTRSNCLVVWFSAARFSMLVCSSFMARCWRAVFLCAMAR
jgi:hypothetical protein